MQTKRWSSEDLRTEFGEGLVLGDVISELEDKFLKSGEVICEIRVNGMFLTEADEERFAKSNLEEIEILEISSRNPKDLISESLNSTLEWIPRVRDYSIETSQLLRGPDLVEARRLFTEVVEGCQWLTDALYLLKSVIIGIAEAPDFEAKWDEAEKELVETIKEVMDSHQNNDYVLLADTMEYDLSTCLDKWLELLSSEPAILKKARLG